MGSKTSELTSEETEKAAKAARKAAKKAAKKAAAAAAAAEPELQAAKKVKKDKKGKKEKKEKRKRAGASDVPASAPKKQRANAVSAPAGDDKLRFWRVKLGGLPAAASAAEITEMLAPALALPAEMIRLPQDSTALSEGEASFTLKVAAEADAARALNLGSGVSVSVEEVAAGTDEEVFVRYLPFVATTQEVEDLFATQGQVVKVKLMAGRSPGLNSGIGFVTYDNPATATAAVEALDGASFMGRSLAVCLAKDRKAKRQPLAPAAGKMPGSASVGPTGARSAPTAPLVVPPDCRSVLVENLVYGCSQRDVRALFKKATKVILLGKLGKARVGFLSAADVREACEQAQGQTSGGRQIRARPELPSEITQDGGHEIFLKYLPKETTEAQLSEFFGQCGEIAGDGPILVRDTATGLCKGVAFITFQTEQGMEQALSWDGCEFGGRRIHISVATKGTLNAKWGIKPTYQAAGTHTPALLEECIRELTTHDPNGVYVDGTFGRGGHTRGLLQKIAPTAQMHAFDLDPEAIVVGKELEAEDSRFTIHHRPFGELGAVLGARGLSPAGLLLDLGISSPQFDDAHRGFRPEQDGPLDLRFDQSKGVSAYEYLNTVDRDELVRVLTLYGDGVDTEAISRRVADAICIKRATGALPTRTREFAKFVAAVKGKEYQGFHPAKLVFQSLRIHLNDEFDELRRGLAAAYEIMSDGGRLGIITWKHSECAIVLDFLRRHELARPDYPMLEYMRAQKGPSSVAESWGLHLGEAHKPSERELKENSRSRSAILWVLVKGKGMRISDIEAATYEEMGWGTPVAPAPWPQHKSHGDTIA